MDNLEHSMDISPNINHQRTILHIDIDCFYAQVEMLKNPELRCHPLGIQQKNIVVTSNYIAREYGIHKCMLVTEALRICPRLLLVQGEDLHDYRQMSTKLTNLLYNFSSHVEKLGLDENFLDVSHLVAERLTIMQTESKTVEGNVYKNIMNDCDCDCGCVERLCVASHIASEIRNQVKEILGLTCCAGVSYNKLLAKLACSINKPNQQTTVFPANSLELLSSLSSVKDIPSIGQHTHATLQTLGISCVTDLQNCTLECLQRTFEFNTALRLKKLSFGIDDLPVKQSGKPQSIGLEDGFRKISLESEVNDKFSILLQRLIKLLAEDGRIPGSVKVTVRKYDNMRKITHRESKQCNISSTVFCSSNISNLSPNSNEKLMTSILQLFHKMVDISKPFHLTLLGVAFTKFQERSTGRSSIASFLMKDISVQSVTCFKSASMLNPLDCASTSHNHVQKPSLTLNTDRSGSESEPEPSPKKTRIDFWITRRKRAVSPDDVESPSKLRVSELCLNSSDSANEPIREVCCDSQMDLFKNVDSVTYLDSGNNYLSKPSDECYYPDNIDKTVFRELPIEVQRELIQSWKSGNSKGTSDIKSTKNTILHYFIKNK